MTDQIFTREYAWSGGNFGLALVIKPSDSERVADALRLLWESDEIDGCYLAGDREPHTQARMPPIAQDGMHLYGLAKIGGYVFPCGSLSIHMETGEDWVYLWIPMVSVYDAFPSLANGDDEVTWKSEISEWFVGRARKVFSYVRFCVAFIGWMPGTEEDEELARFERSGVPAERRLGFLVPCNDELTWFPPTLPLTM